MKVLVTGGAGYIGSTVASACAEDGIDVVVLDNLRTGRAEFTTGHAFYRGDVGDGDLVDLIVREHPDIEVTVHCAALTVVPESVADPIRYYQENVAKTLSLAEALRRNDRPNLIFSSSAAVYDPTGDDVVDEETPLAPRSPYARTKAMTEAALCDIAASGALAVVSLRYFNPVGADPALRTGPHLRRPTHVLGQLANAHETGTPFRLTGTRWPTRDGTAVRDYVHVWDVAAAHVAAIRAFDRVLELERPARHVPVNIGSGRGTTVRELVGEFEHVTGYRLTVEEAPPRPGDTSGCHTTIDKAIRLLDWKPALSVTSGIRDHLAWQARRQEVLGY